MVRLLVVEDETAIREGLAHAFAAHGMAVDTAARGDDGLARALAGGFDLVVLDVMLPGCDGFSVCRTLRERLPHQGILLLTARGAEEDVLEGFAAGADDYVAKPFSLVQLLARADAVLRRARRAPAAAFRAGALSIDPAALVARQGATTTALTRRDVELLQALAAQPGRVVPRAELLAQVWGYARPDAVESRCVDMHLVKLRRKLGAAFGAAGERLVETVRGEGYRLAAGA